MHEDRRRELHEWLDRILDEREQLQSPRNTLGGVFGTPPPADQCYGAREVWKSGITFLSEVLGQTVRAAGVTRLYSGDAEQRDILKSWLTDLYPILYTHPQSILAIAPQRELTVFDVIDALSALDAGEIRSIFLANTGKNRRANRWSLARAKLDALVWKERLKALGHAEKSANFEITKAFGEQWDTIRRWKPQCERILGEMHVSTALEYAGSPRDIYLKPKAGIGNALFRSFPLDPMQSLKNSGAAYRSELTRSAELMKRKPRLS